MRRGTPIQRAAVRALALLCAVLAMWLASAERAAKAAAMHPPEAAALGGRVGGCPRAEAAKPPSTRCSTCAPRRGAPPLLLYLYEGPNRVGVIERGAGAGYTTKDTYLFAGIDDALRLKRGSQVVYFETDLAGNVRRLRASGGGDLGGYRYSAFGKTVEDTAAVDQPHRWKGRWYSQVAGGIYDVRARQWSPQLGAFLTIDEFAFHDTTSTLWGWPGQNPIRFRDPTGHLPMDSAAGGAWDRFHRGFMQIPTEQQAGLSAAMAAGAALGLLGPAAAESAASVETGITIASILSRSALGRAVLAAAGVSAAPAKRAADAGRPMVGQIPPGNLAGQCVDIAKANLRRYPGSQLVSAPSANHWAVQLASGEIKDPSLRDNLAVHGADVADIPKGMDTFAQTEWLELVKRFPQPGGEN